MEFKNLIESYKDDIVKKTQELISIKSVEESPKEGMPFGEGPYNALKYVVNLSKELGFETQEFDGYAAHADLGDGEESVGILLHVDVVPEGDGWTYSPYGGEIHDGRIYGRGAVDDKGPAISALYAMKALKDSGSLLKRKVRIIFGANEETGWGCMKHYFSKMDAPTMGFTPDADFPVINGEKGIIVFDLKHQLANNNRDFKVIDIKGGSAPNMVPDTAVATFEVQEVDRLVEIFNTYKEKNDKPLSIEVDGNIVKVTTKGVSAHGSTPEKGENAISYLMKFLGELLEENDDLYEFVKFYNDRIGSYNYGEKIGCNFEDDISGKLNFNTGMIKYEDNNLILTINIRYPITSSAEEVYSGIRDNLLDTNIILVEGNSDQRPLYVSEDNFLVKKLMDVYRSETQDYDSKPVVIGGGTYARAMENAVAFGPMFPGQKDVAHQKDEYISIDHLIKMTEIYTKALFELTK